MSISTLRMTENNAPLEASMGHTIPASAFEHAPLDQTKASIRLLSIRNDLSESGLIQCDIWHDTVETTYHCLSYVWGSEEDQQNILVNDQLFCVRKNLWNFLAVTRTRDAAAQRVLWIDALSINQASVSERNHQVAQMGLIYSKAAEVIAWLGLDEAIGRALMFCNELGSLHNEYSNFSEVWTMWRQRDMELNGQLEQDFEAFSGSPYWTRAWITQEVLLARKVTLLVGNYECCPEGNLQYHLDYFPWSKSGWASTRPVFMSYIRAVCEETSAKGIPLVLLLQKFPNRECKIPRDQIYSLVAVASDTGTMPIDYGCTFHQFVDQFLSTMERSLCLCSWAHIRATLGLPSRVYSHEYTEPIFIVRMRQLKPSSEHFSECLACKAEYWKRYSPFWRRTRLLSVCIMTDCERFSRRFYFKSDQSGTNTRFTLHCEYDGTKEMELAHVESEPTPHSRSVHTPGPTINIYLKATVLEEMMHDEIILPSRACSNVCAQKGCITVYRGPPLELRQTCGSSIFRLSEVDSDFQHWTYV